MDRQERGRWAEEAACEYLRRRGYEVLERNVRLQRGELDVIARDGDQLWFVEVKSRARSDCGSPLHAVDRRKRRALFAAAREYLIHAQHRGDYGFLGVSVVPDPTRQRPIIRMQRLAVAPPDNQDWH